MPTGTSLVHDIIDIKDGISFSPSASTGSAPSKVDNTKTSHPYYFRIAAGASFPEEPIASEQVRNSYRYITTKPMTVSDAHALASRYENAFVAGYKE